MHDQVVTGSFAEQKGWLQGWKMPAGGGAPRVVAFKQTNADFSQKSWEVAGAIDGPVAVIVRHSCLQC
jgi:hypothetical protein